MQWYCNQWYVPWKDVDGTLFKNNDDDDDVSPLQPKASYFWIILTSRRVLSIQSSPHQALI